MSNQDGMTEPRINSRGVLMEGEVNTSSNGSQQQHLQSRNQEVDFESKDGQQNGLNQNRLGPPLHLWTPNSANIPPQTRQTVTQTEGMPRLSSLLQSSSNLVEKRPNIQLESSNLQDSQEYPAGSDHFKMQQISNSLGTHSFPIVQNRSPPTTMRTSSAALSTSLLSPALQPLNMASLSPAISPSSADPSTDFSNLSRSASPSGRPGSTLFVNEAKRRPFSVFLPREATASPSSILRSPSPSGLRTSPGAHNSPNLPDRGGEDQTGSGMTAWEFLHVEPTPQQSKSQSNDLLSVPNPSSTKASGKGKHRAEVPIMELRILPVTDTVNMFGSTQTSSNYSLSGKVVVRVHNVIRELSTPSQITNGKKNGAYTKSAKKDDGSIWLPQISTEANFFDADQIFSDYLENHDDSDPSSALRVQEVNVMSLSCTFSGYALYVDHSGRFSACKLTEVTEELLPRGCTISIPELGKSQEYEIEFNLSLPGWLPGSLSTRFGGTFYSIEARAKYSAADGGQQQQHAIPSSLVPPRRGSMLPDTSSSDGQSDSEVQSVPLNWQNPNRLITRTAVRNTASDEEEARQASTSSNKAKGRSDSTPPAGKSTWLGKRAKQLAIITKGPSSGTASPTNLSPSPLTTRQTTLSAEPMPSNEFRMPPKLFASRGYISAFSDPHVIIVRRCREVVPVPVARMAIIDADAATANGMRDPPEPIRSGMVNPSPAARHEDVIRPQLPLINTNAPLPQLPLPPLPDQVQQGPPIAPNTFDLPNDPAKAAAHISSTSTSSANQSSPHAPQRTSSAPDPNLHPSNSNENHPNAPPMRHFLHRPMLHPPADANIPNAAAGLPFSLTLSLPSHVPIDGPGSDILNFGVQIEVGRSSMWSKVRELGGLRLRDMELSCVQTERHCSIPSRTFCHAYPMPPEPRVEAEDLPIFGPPPQHAPSGRKLNSSEVRQRRGYDRGLVQYHIDLLQAGRAPHPSANNVERVRTVVVGPPPTPNSIKASGASRSKGNERGKEKEQERKKELRNDGRRRSMHGSYSMPDVHHHVGNNPNGNSVQVNGVENGVSNSTTRSNFDDQYLENMPNDSSGNRRNTGRGRRAYQTAMRGLSNFATAVMDISFDMDDQPNEADGRRAREGVENRNQANQNPGQKSTKDGVGQDSNRAALYSFAGTDGHGVDLTRGRVRMAIKLPLVTSDASRAKSAATPQLVSDFESPFTKTRHKLQVKLGFGFGSKPLGGDGEWGQSLMMCVPVRFTEAAPREVREQFAPLPVRQVAIMSNNNNNAPSTTSSNLATPVVVDDGIVSATPGGSVAPVLPSYNQLFREDGSRLADEGEDLPQYPGPRNPHPVGGSVTGPLVHNDGTEAGEDEIEEVRETSFEGDDGANSGPLHVRARTSSLTSSTTRPIAGGSAPNMEASSSRLPFLDNRIAPSHVLDESIPADKRGNASRALQRAELEELHREEREEESRRLRRISSHRDLQAGIEISNDQMQLLRVDHGSGGESGQEGDLSDSEQARMLEETVNMDDLDQFDDEVPAFALGRLASPGGGGGGGGGSGASGSSNLNRNSMMPTVFNSMEPGSISATGGEDESGFASTRINNA